MRATPRFSCVLAAVGRTLAALDHALAALDRRITHRTSNQNRS